MFRPLPDTIADLVINSNDIISILIALDLKKNGCINSNVSTSILETELTANSLMSEKWLLTYEAITQGWVTTPKIKIVNDNEYFRILHKHKVQFYDAAKTVVPLKVLTPTATKPKPMKEVPEVRYEQLRVGKFPPGAGGGGY